MATSRNYRGDWQRRRLFVLARDRHVCHWCGRWAGTADHVVPIADGGTDDLGNLVAACGSCNSRRSMERNNAHRAAAFVAARGASRPRYLRALAASGPSGALAERPPTGATTAVETSHTPTEGPTR